MTRGLLSETRVVQSCKKPNKQVLTSQELHFGPCMLNLTRFVSWPIRNSLGFLRNMTGPDRAARSEADGRRNIVAVIGTTGVGKSQLAVELAQHVQSRSLDGLDDAIILSSDSMQLYEGLPLITNQVTEEESGGIEHWGINVVRPGQGGPWEIGKWCNEALEKVRACRIVYTRKPMKFDIHVVP